MSSTRCLKETLIVNMRANLGGHERNYFSSVGSAGSKKQAGTVDLWICMVTSEPVYQLA